MSTDNSSGALAPMDALLLKGDADPATRAIMSTALVLERPPSFERLLASFERASLDVPRMREHVSRSAWSLGQPRWTPDEHFDVRQHVRHVGAPGSGTLRDALELASTSATAPFDPARPLWDATLITGLDDGGSVVLLRAHHAIADGVRALQMMASLLDLEADPPPSAQGWERAKRHRAHERIRAVTEALQAQQHWPRSAFASLSRSAIHPIGSLIDAASYGRSALRTFSSSGSTPSPLLRRRSRARIYRTLELTLDGMRTCARAADATVNDVFLTGLLGGLQRYHDALGAPVGDLPITFPINASGGDGPDSGNHFTAAVIPGPSSIIDHADRLAAVHQLVASRRAEMGLDAPLRLAPILHQVPTWLSTAGLAAYSRRIDLQASNVVGPDCPLYLAGSRIRRLFAFGPLPGIPIMAVLVSYDGVCTVGLTLDPAAVTEPDLLTRAFQESFDELLSGATS